jgi:hemin uptake protein HemP
MQGSRSVILKHGDAEYILRITRSNGLVLNKVKSADSLNKE